MHPGRPAARERAGGIGGAGKQTVKLLAGARAPGGRNGAASRWRVRPRILGWRRRRKGRGEGRRRRTGEARQRRFIDWQAEFGRGRVEDFLEGFFFWVVCGYLESEGSNGFLEKTYRGVFLHITTCCFVE